MLVRMFRRFLAAAVLLGLPSVSAHGFDITVDPMGYGGEFQLYGPPASAGWKSGIHVYDLPAGVYTMDIGHVGALKRKSFEVLTDGTVTYVSANDSRGSLEFDGSTVTFRNAAVDFDPRLYAGPIWIRGVTGSIFDIPASLVLVPDNVYAVRLHLISFTNAYFDVMANGNVGPAAPGSTNPNVINGERAFDFDNASTPNPTIRLKNTTVRIDPMAYSGWYSMPLVTSGTVRGVQDLTLIPAFSFWIKLSSLDAAGNFFFQVNDDGSLGFVGGFDASAQVILDSGASVPTVRFRNTTVHFEPGRFAGGYRMDYNQLVLGQWLFGPQTLTLVPSTRYALRMAAEIWVLYAVDGNGEFGPWLCCGTPDSMDRSDSFVFDGDTLRFRNTDIRVEPSDGSTYGIANEVFAPSGATGTHVLSVVPDMIYGVRDFDAGATINFKVLSPCEIDPPGGIAVGATFYAITCVPHANAGDDQTVNEETLVTLDGAASEFPANASPGYSWTQIAGPSVTLDDTAAAQPFFSAPSIDPIDGSQTLTFSLVVSDGTHTSAPDTVDVTVLHVNKAPVADAGDDLAVREGAVVTLSGNHSYDPDGDAIVDYLWSQTAGATVALQPDEASATPQFQAPLADGTPLLFQLTVSDGQLSSVPSPGTDPVEADTVQVAVGMNTAPVANAGPDQTRDEGVSVMLDGTASSDSDGDGVSYAWSQLAGTGVALDDPTSATPSFIAPLVAGGGETLVFGLVVTDDYIFNPKASETDTVAIHVRNANDPPNCDLAAASPNRLWPPNHKMIEIGIDGVSDPNAGDTVTIRITGVMQDEPVNGLGDGDTGPDAIVQSGADGNDTLLLRSERAGYGNGRVYHISFSASDGDASCSGTLTVDVPHSRKGGALDDGANYDSTSH